MKKVFVTGANGFLGTNIVLALINHGYMVKALLRNLNSFINFSHSNLELINGDIFDTELLAKNIETCNYVIHIAAITDQSLLKFIDYYPVNVKGTQNIVDICVHNKIEKLVYIGTANTDGYGSLHDLGSEKKAMKYPFTKSLYALSKFDAQKLINEASKIINITSICPTFILGGYDLKPSSGKMILMILNKRIIFYPSGGKNFVHVKDVVSGIISAFDIKESGKCYILANENIKYKDFLKRVLLYNNQKSLIIKLPDIIVKILGLLGELLRCFGIKTNMSKVNAKILTINSYYSNLKAKSELDLSFTSIDDAIKNALDWFNSTTWTFRRLK